MKNWAEASLRDFDRRIHYSIEGDGTFYVVQKRKKVKNELKVKSCMLSDT